MWSTRWHPAIAAGWILGLVTSLPEAVTLGGLSDRTAGGNAGRLAQMQELDNLAASNMSNSGLIYPVGLGIFR